MLYSPHFICIPYLFNKFPFVGHLGCSLIVIPFWIYLDGQISQLDQNNVSSTEFLFLFLQWSLVRHPALSMTLRF